MLTIGICRERKQFSKAEQNLSASITVALRFFKFFIVSNYLRKSFLKVLRGIYLLKVNNRNTGTRCEICSELTIKKPERRQRCRSGVFIVNFKHTSHLVLVFLSLTLNM